MPEIKLVKITDIVPNPIREIDAGQINDLRESVKQYGILQPILVRLLSKDKYEIVFGNHRWYAAKGAGLKEIPCIIRELNDSEALFLALSENIQRLDMNPVETGRILSKLEKAGVSLADSAKKLGKSLSWVQIRVQIAEGLCEELQSKIGTMSIANAYRLSRLPKARQPKIFENIETYRESMTIPEGDGFSMGGGIIGYGTGLCLCPKCGAEHIKRRVA